MIAETIYWHDAEDVKPRRLRRDLVLFEIENGGVGSGFYWGGEWFWLSGGTVQGKVISWADMPRGTQAQKPA